MHAVEATPRKRSHKSGIDGLQGLPECLKQKPLQVILLTQNGGVSLVHLDVLNPATADNMLDQWVKLSEMTSHPRLETSSLLATRSYRNGSLVAPVLFLNLQICDTTLAG